MPQLTTDEVEDFLLNVLSEDERKAIEFALIQVNPWAHGGFAKPIKDHLESVKFKIKVFHLARVNTKCCYCQRSLNDATIEADREHVVPKSFKKSLSYDIFNISISCKRCNMTYKGERLDHIANTVGIENDVRNPDRYLIPHPNIDNCEDHLQRVSFQIGTREIATYHCHSDKGRFLYGFVELNRLCVSEIDMAQGGASVNDAIAILFDLPLRGA